MFLPPRLKLVLRNHGESEGVMLLSGDSVRTYRYIIKHDRLLVNALLQIQPTGSARPLGIHRHLSRAISRFHFTSRR